MKEIDFIPSWYHQNRQRQAWYFRRYMMILIVTAVWMVGNLLTGGVISRAYGELDSLRSSYEKGLRKIDQARALEARLAVLSRQQQLLSRLCPRTRLSSVLAELSACIGTKVVLTDLSVMRTAPEVPHSTPPGDSAAVRIKRRSADRQADATFESDTVLKIDLAGIAVDGAEVAALISRLEQSDYFRQVVPVFSKNQTRLDTTVTEFEIRCLVADFEIVE